MGGCEKEESHVQAQVLDEQGDRHRQAQHTHTEDSFIMVHGMLDIMSPPWRLSVCGSQCGHIHVKTRTDEQYMGKT